MNIGIDIGSTASKVIVFDKESQQIVHKFLMPSGWNSKETAIKIYNKLKQQGIDIENAYVVATGYGRISVPYADRVVTEITTHAKGAMFLLKKDCYIIDIGGQDTKVIDISNGLVSDFIMNDKCSAGTGKFLEIMSNRLGVTLDEMFELSKAGNPISISSTCTVFAESEVISLMGEGRAKEDIASGIIYSIVNKVVGQTRKFRNETDLYFLTGGFANNTYIVELLSKVLGKKVETHELGRFAGALGAALM